jgi:predicted dehydrogenase
LDIRSRRKPSNRKELSVAYKSCCLGCGPRARGHAAAYEHVAKSRLEAVCDMNSDRLEAFADEFGVPRRYTDLPEMLDKEEPDLLHVVTQPTERVDLLKIAAQFRVPAVLIEKPLALDAEDYNALSELAGHLSMRVCVNHQLRYHPKVLELLDVVRSGRIGEVRLVDGSARYPLAGQGTHVLNLMFAFAGDSRPSRVFGQAGGELETIPHHPCPARAVGEMVFGNRVHGLLACGANAPVVHDPQVDWMHKRVAVYGTRGFVHWTMNSWEVSTAEGGYQQGEKSYGEEDILGQAAMTDAIFEWLEDEDKPHANRLEVSLAEVNTVLGIYRSAVDRDVVSLPFTPAGSLMDELKASF